MNWLTIAIILFLEFIYLVGSVINSDYYSIVVILLLNAWLFRPATNRVRDQLKIIKNGENIS